MQRQTSLWFSSRLTPLHPPCHYPASLLVAQRVIYPPASVCLHNPSPVRSLVVQPLCDCEPKRSAQWLTTERVGIADPSSSRRYPKSFEGEQRAMGSIVGCDTAYRPSRTPSIVRVRIAIADVNITGVRTTAQFTRIQRISVSNPSCQRQTSAHTISVLS